jgi:hypothetical protein
MERNSSIGNFQSLTDGYRIVAALRRIQGFLRMIPKSGDRFSDQIMRRKIT